MRCSTSSSFDGFYPLGTIAFPPSRVGQSDMFTDVDDHPLGVKSLPAEKHGIAKERQPLE